MITPILRHLRALERDDVSGDGERAREELAEYLADLDKAANRFTERRAGVRERARRDATREPATAPGAAT